MTSFQVCDDLQVDTAPCALLCNVHQLMMIHDARRKLKDMCRQIHDSLAIKCFSNFVNQEHSAKLWNHCNHFEEFIAPKRKYFSLPLKDNHFNSDAVTLQKLDKVV